MSDETSTGEQTTSNESHPLEGLFTAGAPEVQAAPTESADPAEGSAVTTGEESPVGDTTGPNLEEIFAASDEDAPWDGKSPLNEHPRFKKLVAQKNAAKDRIEILQAQIADLEARGQEVPAQDLSGVEVLNELYGEFDDKIQAMREDAQIVRALVALKDAGVSQVSELVKDYLKPYMETGQIPKVVNNTNEQAPKPTEVPPVAADTDSKVADLTQRLLQKEWKAEIDSVLTATKIRPELRNVLETAVLSRVDTNEESNTKAVQDAALQYIKEMNWDLDFVTGGNAKAKPAPKAPPQGTPSGATTSTKAAEESEGAGPKGEEHDTETQDGYRSSLREQLRELVVAGSN